MHISEVTTGATLHVWNKTNAPLTIHRDPRGALSYKVATHVTRQAGDMFNQFAATVHRNDTTNKLLYLNVVPVYTSRRMLAGQSLPAVIHYSNFKIVHLISPFSYPGGPSYPEDNRPTKITPLSNNSNSPYKTAEALDLV